MGAEFLELAKQFHLLIYYTRPGVCASTQGVRCGLALSPARKVMGVLPEGSHVFYGLEGL